MIILMLKSALWVHFRQTKGNMASTAAKHQHDNKIKSIYIILISMNE